VLPWQLQARAFQLLTGLSENNTKVWFDSHRKEIAVELMDPFSRILARASEQLANRNVSLMGGKQTMFRMNRDTRFSHDKRPYKDSISGVLTPDGNKNPHIGLVYLHLDATGGMVAGGFYQFPTDRLYTLRVQVATHPEEFSRIRKGLEHENLYFDATDSLKTMPRDFAELRDHPHADIIRLKTLIVKRKLPRKFWLNGSVADEVVRFSESLADFLHFGNEALRVTSRERE
jgi:uncharacterized protein (TIGR02453 family)